ncbi:MAG: toll/interleukin-1 receptor domain-containing protein [Atopobiaceae bacterium]|nr:toll/interleukin-1 receptor domain-containing protein [Atopobiaceae bacterium]
MNALVSKTICTAYGDKTISVHTQDIVTLDSPLDIMTVSSFYREYQPVKGTIIGALDERGIPVHELAGNPMIDLREPSNIWLSHAIINPELPIKRIGCIELEHHMMHGEWQVGEEQILSSIQSYFHMLHIASLAGASVGRVGMPVLGTGNQGVDAAIVMVPTLNECIRFLKTCPEAKEIRIITRNQQLAFRFALTLQNSYFAQREESLSERRTASANSDALAFISYSSFDKNVADNLCSKLEGAGIKVWYAPRDIASSDYASAIVKAISRCTYFVVILSSNSLRSQHVLNEIDLAFQELDRNVRIMPLRIDEKEMGPSFRYYLSRHHWMDAHVPPLEKRLEEFVTAILASR